MNYYMVKDEFDEDLKVELHDEPIENPETMMSEGQWSCTLSPRERESYKPHYSVEVFEDGYEGMMAMYRGQFFVEDHEYDTFIVDVVEMGGTCETTIHCSHTSPMDGETIYAIALTVQEIEVVLSQIAEKHDKTLGIK